MASSALRPTLLRQLEQMSTKRAYSALTPAFRSQAQLTSRPTWAIQRAAFQTSAARRILPPLPQVIKGTVNDPVAVPGLHPSHGSYHWTAERAVSIGLIPVTIMPFAVGSLNPLLDGTLIGLIILHTYIGFQSVITDYFPAWRVPFWRKTFDWLNVLAVAIVGWGWYEFETNDVGLTAAVARIWRAGATAKQAAKEAEEKLS